MARIRTVKPEFWTSAQVMECSRDARLLFIGLWNFCDDAGRHPFNAKQIKALVFPGDDLSIGTVRGWLDELVANDLICIYAIDGKDYFQVTGWKHQKIDRPQDPKYPGPFDDNSVNCREPSTTARDGEERKGEEGKGGEGERARATRIPAGWKPTEETISAVRAAGLSHPVIERETRKYLAHYEANGAERVDWQAGFRKWCLKEAQDHPPAPAAMQAHIVAITANSPSWDAWRTHYRDIKANARVSLMDAAVEQHKPFSVPSEWPPGHPRARESPPVDQPAHHVAA